MVGGCLMNVYLMNVHLTGMHLMRIYFIGRVSHGLLSHRHVSDFSGGGVNQGVQMSVFL